MCISHISGENIRDVNQKYDQMLISSRYTMSDSRNNDDSRFLCVYCPCPKKKKKTYPCAVNQLKGKTLCQNVHLGCYSINGGLSRTLEAYLSR